MLSKLRAAVTGPRILVFVVVLAGVAVFALPASTQSELRNSASDVVPFVSGPTTPATPTADQAFEDGDSVVISVKTVAWQNDTKTFLISGQTGTVVDGPMQFKGDNWYQVEIKSARGNARFWVPSPVLERGHSSTMIGTTETKVPPRLTAGDRVVVTNGTVAYQGNKQTPIQSGRTGTVLNGPRRSMGRTWYQVRLQMDDHQERFSLPVSVLKLTDESHSESGGDSTPTASGDSTPTTDDASVTDSTGADNTGTQTSRNVDFDVGDVVKTRFEAKTISENPGVLKKGYSGEIVHGPEQYANESWYHVKGAYGRTWIRKYDLEMVTPKEDKVTTTEPTQAQISVGDVVETAYPTTVVRDVTHQNVPEGLVGRVVAGPDLHEGNMWFKVDLEQGNGGGMTFWAKAEALDIVKDVKQSSGRSTATKFTRGQLAKVAEESVAWESDDRLTVQQGTTGRIGEGPKAWNGTIWYSINTGERVLWVPSETLKPATEGDRASQPS
jgi:ribosomal protein L21E